MWKRALSQTVKDELRRLQQGNVLEIQRFENADEAISSVLINPLDPGYLKDNFGHFRAVNVLGQYRLFFEIIPQHGVIHFVWLNDDYYIHDSSKGKDDPCYKRFKHLFDHDKLDKYVHEKPTVPKFDLTGTWKKSAAIFAKYLDDSGRSETSLTLISDSANSTYRLLDIKSDRPNVGLEKILLSKVIESANKAAVKLSFTIELSRNKDYVSFHKNLLTQLGFKLSLADDDQEVWEK